MTFIYKNDAFFQLTNVTLPITACQDYTLPVTADSDTTVDTILIVVTDHVNQRGLPRSALPPNNRYIPLHGEFILKPSAIYDDIITSTQNITPLRKKSQNSQ